MSLRFSYQSFCTRYRDWIAAGLLSVAAFGIVVAPLVVHASQEELASYVLHANIPLFEETVDGYRQIYTIWNGEKVFFTTESRNHTQAMSAGQYIVWVETVNGAGQIVRYDIPTATEIRITDSSTNQHPRINQAGLVVWERWMGDRWQIFYFDGIAMIQLTDGDVSTDPELNGNQLLFSRQNDGGEWRAYTYDFDSRDLTELLVGPDAHHPLWEAGEIIFPIKIARERAEAAAEALAASITLETPLDSESLQLFERGAITEEQYLLRIAPTLAPPPAATGPAATDPDVFVSSTELLVTDTSTTPEESVATPTEDAPLVPAEPSQVTEDDIRRELTDAPVVTDTLEVAPVEGPVSVPTPEPSVIESVVPVTPDVPPSVNTIISEPSTPIESSPVDEMISAPVLDATVSQ